SNPVSRKPDKKRWIEGEFGFDGRRTSRPTLVTSPAFATPPASGSSCTSPVWLLRRDRPSAGLADRLGPLGFGRARLPEHFAGLRDPEPSDRSRALVELPVGARRPGSAESAGQQPQLTLTALLVDLVVDLLVCARRTPRAHD